MAEETLQKCTIIQMNNNSTRSTSSPTLSAMFSNVKERKNNILVHENQFKEPREGNARVSKIMTAQCGRRKFNIGQTPPPPTPVDASVSFRAPESIASEDYSYSSTQNDLNSLTSSDWGDEACEHDRQRSRHVQMLFDTIERMLYECTGQKQSSLADANMALVAHLMPECREWASRFPHFRLCGDPIRPRSSFNQHPSLISRVSCGDQQHRQRPPFLSNRGSRLRAVGVRRTTPDVAKVTTIPDSVNGPFIHLHGSPLLVQGQQLTTPLNTGAPNTNFRANRYSGSRLAAIRGSPRDSRELLVNGHPGTAGYRIGATPLSVLMEDNHTGVSSPTLSKSPIRPPPRQVTQQHTTTKVSRTHPWKSSPQRAIYVGSTPVELAEGISGLGLVGRPAPATNSDGDSDEVSLRQALVGILLSDALEVLQNVATKSPVGKIDNFCLRDPSKRPDPLSNSAHNLSCRKARDWLQADLKLSRDAHRSPTPTRERHPPRTAAAAPSSYYVEACAMQPRRRRKAFGKPVSENFILSCTSFQPNSLQVETNNTPPTTTKENDNDKVSSTPPHLSATWPDPKNAPARGRHQPPLLPPIAAFGVCPQPSRQQTPLPCGRHPDPETNNRLPPISPLAVGVGGTGGVDRDSLEVACSTNVSLVRGGGSGVEHSSRLATVPQRQVRHSVNLQKGRGKPCRQFGSKPHTSFLRTTQIHYSVAITSSRHRPNDTM